LPARSNAVARNYDENNHPGKGKMLSSDHKVTHWVLATPVGEFDRLDSAMKAVKEEGIPYRGDEGPAIRGYKSDRPVAQPIKRRK
jgi:hypothetical protein